MFDDAIRRTYQDPLFWTVLLDQSTAGSGPFDGGCLICAKAIILAFDGKLIRITSNLNGDQIEHYGVEIDHVIYDFDGKVSSAEKWLERFRINENIIDRKIYFATGLDSATETPDDPYAVKAISKLLIKNHQAYTSIV